MLTAPSAPQVAPRTTHSLTQLRRQIDFDASKIANNQIEFNNPHDLQTGQPVLYTSIGGSELDGLANSVPYYVIKIDDYHVELAVTERRAQAGEAIALTATSEASTHGLIATS